MSSNTISAKLKDIIKDDDIYPRQSPTQSTIDAYIEALKARALFPPIEVQRVKTKDENEDDVVRVVLLDGWHRILAYRGFNKWVTHSIKKRAELKEGEEDASLAPKGTQNIKEIQVVFWKDEELDKNNETHLKELMIRSAELNMRHGLRLSKGDVKSQLQKIAGLEGSLDFVWKDIAEKFDVTPTWTSLCVSSILSAKRASRDAQIYELELLGWTQEEIAERMGKTQPNINKIITKFNQLNSVIISSFESGKSVEELTEYYKIRIPLVWAILLDGKNDTERLEAFGIEPELYNVWDFLEQDNRLGQPHNNQIPGQIALNILYYYTEPGDLVIDPMATGGSIIDACLVMGRKCRAYDFQPLRDDIVQHDIRNGLPEECKGTVSFFLHPPYYKAEEEECGHHSISGLQRNLYLAFFRKIADDIYDCGAKNIALLTKSRIDTENPDENIFIWDYVDIFNGAGWRPIEHIFVPLRTERLYSDLGKTFRDAKRFARITQSLVIFERKS